MAFKRSGVRSSLAPPIPKAPPSAVLFYKRGHSSVGRAIGSQSIGREFDPPWLHQFFKSTVSFGSAFLSAAQTSLNARFPGGGSLRHLIAPSLLLQSRLNKMLRRTGRTQTPYTGVWVLAFPGSTNFSKALFLSAVLFCQPLKLRLTLVFPGEDHFGI